MKKTDEQLRAIEALTAAMDQVREQRLDAMQTARDAGHTWRVIAIAAGMTEKGVRFALDNRR